jgi:hypothetical protein
MKREEMLKKLIEESKDIKENKKLHEQVRRDDLQFDDHCGAIIGKRSHPPGEPSEKK